MTAIVMIVLPACAKTYKIGDTCPAGGIVFLDRMLIEAGFTDEEWAVYSATTKADWRYISVAPVSSEFTATYHEALQKSKEMKIGGFNDWYLPTGRELNFMFDKLRALGKGDFQPEKYWSCDYAEYFGEGVYFMFDFGDGKSDFERGDYYSSDTIGRVRVVRAFGTVKSSKSITNSFTSKSSYDRGSGDVGTNEDNVPE